LAEPVGDEAQKPPRCRDGDVDGGGGGDAASKWLSDTRRRSTVDHQLV